MRGAWCQALSLPRPPVLWSGQPGFRDPCVPGAVDAGVWTQHRPHSVHPCGQALLAVAVVEGRPGGGVPSTVVWGAWCQALSLPRPPVLWSGQPGFQCACVFVCVLCLAGSGGPASRARSGPPHLFLWPLCLSALLGPLQAGVAPLSLAALAVPRCLGAVLWFFFSASRCLALRALAPRSCLLLGRWLLLGGFSPHLLPFCVSLFSSLLLGALVLFFFSFFFLFFFLPLCAPAVSGFLLFPAPGALGLGAVRFLLCWPSASRLSVRLSLFRAFRLAPPVGCCPPPPSPPLFVSRFSSLPLGAVCRVLCCAVRPWVRCCAALLRVVFSGVALFCAVLCSLGAAACCAVPSGAARCPGALCSAALRFAVFPRAVCVLSWRGGACCCSPLCFVLCVSRAAVLCVPCPLRSVQWCCGVPWCGAGSAGPWLSAFRCLCLAAWSVSLRLVWFAVVPCFPVSCSVVLCCRVVLCCCALLSCCGAVGACFALLWAVVLRCVVLLVRCAVFCRVVVAACCGALLLVLCVPCLLRSVRCGALLCWLSCPASLCRVLWRCAVVWCCAVVLCCRFAVLFVFALPSCGPSCGASVVCAVVGASCCGVSLCVVVSPWAFCGVVVLLWCVVVSCCAVRCPVVSCTLCRVLRCRAALLGLFLAWVWLYLLEKLLQNFVKYFFFFLFFFFFFFCFGF